MNERSLQSIKDHLQKRDAQERIEQHIRRGRSEATVTIGRAARLFNFSENQLRDWEVRGLLNPLRSKDTTGQRQYSLAELDKLAVIRELMDAGYSLGEIPTNVDDIWYSIYPFSKQQERLSKVGRQEIEHLYIDQRIERTYGDIFWRYYASQALRFSLMLIAEDIPDTIVGLVLPLRQQVTPDFLRHPNDLVNIGESLIGWLRQDLSFTAFLDSAPSFEYPTDFRVGSLQSLEETAPNDSTLIVIQRKAKSLTLSKPLVETIRRLLAPLYGVTLENWRSYFGQGMRDSLYESADFSSSTSPNILKGLADMTIHLGGQMADGKDRWRFCCILLPENFDLPLQQQSLVVRSQSRHSPHKVGGTTVSPDRATNSLSLRAYQSGHVIYRSLVLDTDTSISHHTVEGPVRSAIAVPIGWENGSAVAVLYVVSYETDAFSEGYQRVLRIVGRMIEEAILTYRVRQQVAVKLTNVVDRPRSVDPLFEDFFSENDFVRDVEKLLTALKAQLGEWKEPRREVVSLEEKKRRYREWEATGEVVSFIAVDINNQSSLATKYGDQAARNLSRELGLRIRGQQRLSTHPEHRKVYHIHADRFYLILKGITLEEVRNKAEKLKSALDGNYLVEARRVSAERLKLPEGKLELSNVTVRSGVASYPYEKLKEMLQRFSFKAAEAAVRAEIMLNIDELLNLGQQEGGNVIISWNTDSWSYIPWGPVQ